ncbi:SRPBCC family protein [Rhodococcus sp. NPDC059234]|uniref:SRPBCC family protein n=1 Tax=Rhodococcus sp. NPDC059234 TaxID=3346781 RepID=UPI00366D29E1
MGRQFSYVLERSGRAEAAVMFDLLRDAESWTDWAGSPITYAAWRDGAPDAGEDVVGRVRLVGTERFQTPEEVTVDDRPHVHGYRILSRWPVRDYESRVEFLPRSDGTTTVRWSGEFIERVPGTGWLWRRFLVRFLGGLADNLVQEAQRRARTLD